MIFFFALVCFAKFLALKSVRNEIEGKMDIQPIQNKEPKKPNDKIPYWYIDPSIVYRAMTSPVK